VAEKNTTAKNLKSRAFVYSLVMTSYLAYRASSPFALTMSDQILFTFSAAICNYYGFYEAEKERKESDRLTKENINLIKTVKETQAKQMEMDRKHAEMTRKHMEMTKDIQDIVKKQSQYTVEQILEHLRRLNLVYYVIFVYAKGGTRKGVWKQLKPEGFRPVNSTNREKENMTMSYIRIDSEVIKLRGLDAYTKDLEDRTGIQIIACFLVDVVSHMAAKNKFYNDILNHLENPEVKKKMLERIALDYKINISKISDD